MNAETPKPIRMTRLFCASDAFILDAELERLAASLAKVYSSLPLEAQADAIVLGHSLSNLRRKIKVLQGRLSDKKGTGFPEHKSIAA